MSPITCRRAHHVIEIQRTKVGVQAIEYKQFVLSNEAPQMELNNADDNSIILFFYYLFLRFSLIPVFHLNLIFTIPMISNNLLNISDQ